MPEQGNWELAVISKLGQDGPCEIFYYSNTVPELHSLCVNYLEWSLFSWLDSNQYRCMWSHPKSLNIDKLSSTVWSPLLIRRLFVSHALYHCGLSLCTFASLGVSQQQELCLTHSFSQTPVQSLTKPQMCASINLWWIACVSETVSIMIFDSTLAAIQGWSQFQVLTFTVPIPHLGQDPGS